MLALIVLVFWEYGETGSVQAQAASGNEQSAAGIKPGQARFTKANNGVITDTITGLEWFVGPNSDNTWRQAKTWTENLAVAGGGWRLPTVAELKAIYQKDAGPINLDPVFHAPPGAWVWSGELNNAWSAWGFAFYNGLEGWHSLDYAYGRLALAVRSRR